MGRRPTLGAFSRGADGGRTGILIEWKYTESYLDEKQKHGEFYRPLLEAPDGPIDVTRCGGVEALFVDPLYQLARLQLLAQALERTGAADRVLVVVIVPDGNADYRAHLPGNELRARYPGSTLERVWRSTLRRPDRFALTSVDKLLRGFRKVVNSAMDSTLQDLSRRYTARDRVLAGSVERASHAI